MNFPMQLTFKIMALAPQIFVADSSGQLVFYVKQKLFKLKEAVSVFGDQAQTDLKYTIAANKVIDFSARYFFKDANGLDVGSVKRQGMKSLFKAQYDIYDGEEVEFSIKEDNPWIKFLDALLSEIPILGILTGYLFNPKYNVTRPDGTRVARLIKQPAFFEGKFSITQEAEMDEFEERRIALSLLMMVLLERRRG